MTFKAVNWLMVSGNAAKPRELLQPDSAHVSSCAFRRRGNYCIVPKLYLAAGLAAAASAAVMLVSTPAFAGTGLLKR